MHSADASQKTPHSLGNIVRGMRERPSGVFLGLVVAGLTAAALYAEHRWLPHVIDPPQADPAFQAAVKYITVLIGSVPEIIIAHWLNKAGDVYSKHPPDKDLSRVLGRVLRETNKQYYP